MIKIGPMIDGVQVAEIIGNLTENETSEFICMINQVFQRNKRPFLVLDVKKLKEIDDKGVRAICIAICRADDNCGKIVLARSEDHPVRRILELRRLNINFEIYNTVLEAVKVLQKQVPPISA